ncbi:hypothetical protein GPA00_00275 [Streptococcus equinus]|uniref:sigma factor-like helix-turn-helix DNA-binding protein n=1 Tax=Streptococcus equinus TaxID=1335 RepID=UPI0012F77ACD|nr:sigma factor-like helix-turn-helix DNA-binding protein [Streptococcus equinus]QGX45630.1 hypothetical protein GPA00_00275 [Streptococcus equinus]
MISIFFLENYGLTHNIAKKVSEAGLSLIDFLVKNNIKLYSKQITSSNRNKVFSAIQRWITDDRINTDIFDDVIMLKSVDKFVHSRIFQTNKTISELKIEIELKAKEGNLSVTTNKVNQLINEYENSLSKSEEIRVWEAFVVFLQNPMISIQDIEYYELDSEIFLKLEKMDLIFSDGEIRYLNVENLFEKDIFITYFKIDENMFPKKEDSDKVLSLYDYLKTDFKDKELFLQRINGLTLQEIGDKAGITRERVRQRLTKVKKSLPDLMEVDTYGELYREYEISKEIFINIFNQDEKIYNLLSFLFSKGKKNIIGKILNGDYPQKSKDYVMNVSRKVQIGTDIKIATKENALVEVMKENKDLQTYLTKDEMFYLYNEHVRAYPKLVITKKKNLTAVADNSRSIIKSLSKGYRFFEGDLSYDEVQFLKNIITELSPGAYNMNYVFVNNKDFMEQINILDGSELHNLYHKFNIQIPNMILGRNPEFIFDITSKKDFIFQKIKFFHGRTVDEFVDYLNSDYGLQKLSTKSYLSNNFSDYIENKIIFIDLENYSDIETIFENFLNDEIYLYEDFEKIIKDNSLITKVTPLLISRLGFRNRGTLVIKKKYSSAKNALASKILSGKIFYADKKIYKTQDFYSVLLELEKEFKVIKIGENKYLNTSILKDKGFNFGKFQKFLERIDNFTEYDSYFSIKSLINSGFRDVLIDEGFELITLDRLISILDIFKPVTNSFPTLYHKGDKKFLNDFLLDSLLEYGSVNIEDFTDDINERYGLNLEEASIKYRLLQEGIFYSKELNKVYIYKTDYLDEVYGK